MAGNSTWKWTVLNAAVWASFSFVNTLIMLVQVTGPSHVLTNISESVFVSALTGLSSFFFRLGLELAFAQAVRREVRRA